MAQVTLLQPHKQLSELIAAANRGEEVVIQDGEQAPVKLVPVTTPRAPRKAGSAKGKIIMADDFDAPLELRPQPRFGSAKGLIVIYEDFDAPLEDFKEYM